MREMCELKVLERLFGALLVAMSARNMVADGTWLLAGGNMHSSSGIGHKAVVLRVTVLPPCSSPDDGRLILATSKSYAFHKQPSRERGGRVRRRDAATDLSLLIASSA